jgi:nucleoside-diphosphate-sugar epimerase
MLTPSLLQRSYNVIGVDLCLFSAQHLTDKRLTFLHKDFREITIRELKEVDYVIHLAGIANDPTSDLRPELSWEVNCVGTFSLLEKCKRAKIKGFVYASSGSVYGVKSEERVTEDLSCEPISLYNKTKIVAEKIVNSYSDFFNVFIVRPATVCGVSPRMRLDVVVNLLTWQATFDKKLTVLGGSQIRPHIHINDMVRVYLHILESNRIRPGIYNAGFENIGVLQLAENISKKTGVKITVEKSNDPRSYRIDSTKLIDTGFTPSKNVDQAIEEISNWVSSCPKNIQSCFSVDWLKSHPELLSKLANVQS